MHNFIISICENSSPESGIRLGDEYNDLLNEIKAYNYDKIYRNKKFDVLLLRGSDYFQRSGSGI